MSSRQELRDLARTIHRGEGDAIAGERVLAQARELSRPLVVPGTSSHRMQEITLRSNVLCVIDRAFKLKDGAFKIREKTKEP